MKKNILQTTIVVFLTLIFSKTSFAQVTLFSDCNFGGVSQQLTEGKYDLRQQKIGNDMLSSIKIPSDYSVSLYADENFGGASIVLNADVACLVDKNFNDKATGIEIIKKRSIPINSKTIPTLDAKNVLGRVEKTFTSNIGGIKTTTKVTIDKGKFPGKSGNATSSTTEQNKKDTKDNNWLCTSKDVKVDIKNDEFMNMNVSGQAASIYPGAIYSYESYFGGSFNPAKGPRNPITLSISAKNLSGQSYQTINNPAQYSIREGVRKLWSGLGNNANNAGFAYKCYELHNSAEMNLAISAGGYGFGFKANDNFTMNNKSDYRYFMIDATKDFFTIDCSMPDAGLFSNSADVQPDYMYMSSVTYGVRALAMIETKLTSEEMKNKLDASYTGAGFGGNISIDMLMKSLSEESTIRIYVVGGNSKTLGKVANREELESQINNVLTQSNNSQGEPTKFIFKNMNDDVVRVESATDFFPVKNCIPAAKDKKYEVTITLNTVMKENGMSSYGEVGLAAFRKLPNGSFLPQVSQTDKIQNALYCHNLGERNDRLETPNISYKFRFSGSEIADGYLRLYYRVNDYYKAQSCHHAALDNASSRSINADEIGKQILNPGFDHFSLCDDANPRTVNFFDIRDIRLKDIGTSIDLSDILRDANETATFKYLITIKPIDQ